MRASGSRQRFEQGEFFRNQNMKATSALVPLVIVYFLIPLSAAAVKEFSAVTHELERRSEKKKIPDSRPAFAPLAKLYDSYSSKFTQLELIRARRIRARSRERQSN